MKIILASGSPRRKKLLSEAGFELEIITADVDETLPPEVHPSVGVEILARRKGEAVAKRLPADHPPIVSADTLVELDGVALGKPGNEEEAFRMLSALSGKTHHVHTGISVIWNGKILSCVDSSAVTFARLTEKQIRDYIATGEPMDKAGAYGIQAGGGAFVSGIEGNFDTVVGLCVEKTVELLTAIAED